MSGFKDVLALFETTFVHANPIDEELYKKIKIFRINWAQKNEDHIEFLGGTLIGSQPVRFSSLDEDNFFIDVLNVDRDTLVTNIRITKGIDYKRKVESNPFYLTIMYLCHKFTISRLPEKIKTDAVKELYYLFAYKTISSLIMHYFKFNAEVSLLKAVENRLSGKFLIRQVDSWQDLFEYRSRDILPSGLHYQRMKKFSTDDCLRMIRDLQGRIRDIIKNIYAILIEVKEANEKVISTNNIVEGEDGITIGDVTNGNDIYVKELARLISSERDLIDNDLLYLISSVVKQFEVNDVISFLQYISNNDFKCKKDLAEIIVLEGIEALERRRLTNYNKNFLDVLRFVRNWFISSHNSKEFRELKKELEKEAVKVLFIKKNWRTMTATTNVCIYLFCKAITNIKK